MKRSLLLIPLLALLTLNCQSDNRQEAEADNTQVPAEQKSPTKIIERVVGEWAIDSAAAGGQQQSAQRIIFTQEARYVVYSGQQKVDSGAYRMNEQLTNLYLESEMNGQPKEYELSMNGDEMTLKPTLAQSQSQNQTPPQSGEEAVTYRRIGSGTSPRR